MSTPFNLKKGEEGSRVKELEDWKGAVDFVVKRPDGLTVVYFKLIGGDMVRQYSLFPRDLAHQLQDRLSLSNPASAHLSHPVLSKSSNLISNTMMAMLARMPKESLEYQRSLDDWVTLYGFDRNCLDWDCSTKIKFPLSLESVVVKLVDASVLEPVKIQVLRFHVCIQTIFTIWISLSDVKAYQPTMAMYHPATIRSSEETRTRMAIFRRYAIWPIFGSSQACWEALEKEYEAVKDYSYCWPVDTTESLDLSQIRALFAVHSPDSVPICDLLEALVGQMLCLPSIVSHNIYYPIFSNALISDL